VNYISDWTTVTTNVVIDYDLEEHPLQVKTDSVLGSGDAIIIILYSAGEYTDCSEDPENCTFIAVIFQDPPKYFIYPCTGTNTSTLPVYLPQEQEKIWTFTKTATAIIYECNGVEVLNYVFSDSANESCVAAYSQDIEKIQFDYQDSASDQYRQLQTGECFTAKKSLR